MLMSFIKVLLPHADSPINTVNGCMLNPWMSFNGPIFLIVIYSLMCLQ